MDFFFKFYKFLGPWADFGILSWNVMYYWLISLNLYLKYFSVSLSVGTSDKAVPSGLALIFIYTLNFLKHSD